MILRAKKNISKYKSVNHWLKAVYRNNKEEIDQAFGGMLEKGTSFRGFKVAVIDTLNQRGVDISSIGKRKLNKVMHSAVSTVGRSNLFMTKSERYREYALSGLRKSPEAMKLFKEKTKEKGKYKKLDIEKLRYKDGQYEYGDNLIINYRESPERVEISYKDDSGQWKTEVFYESRNQH